MRANFDPCVACTAITPTGETDGVVVEFEPPGILDDDIEGKPLLRVIAKLSEDLAVIAGAFGRILLYNASNGSLIDQGSKWPRRPTDAAFFASGSVIKGVVGGQLLDILYTGNGGVDWTPADRDWELSSTYQINALAFNAAHTAGIAVGDLLGGSIPGSGRAFIAITDGGAGAEYEQWTQILNAPAPVTPVNPATVSLNAVTIVAEAACNGSQPETAYAVGAGGLVIKSTDSGASWTVQSSPSQATELHGVSFATPCTGYVVGELARVFKTTNGATSPGAWAQIPIAATGQTIYDVETWGDGTNAIAVGEDGSVWVYTGFRFGLVDLEEYGLTIEEDLYDVEVIGNGAEVWVSGQGGVLLHRDANLDWSNPPSGTTIDLPKVAFPTSTKGYAVGVTFSILETQPVQ